MCHFVVNCASLWCFKNKSSEFDAFDMVLIATGVCSAVAVSVCSDRRRCCYVIFIFIVSDFTWNNAFFNLVGIVNYLLCKMCNKDLDETAVSACIECAFLHSFRCLLHAHCKSIQSSEVH